MPGALLNEEDEKGYTDVVYSADGRSITLYLEGAVPQTTANRALSSDLAKMGHDFFEVVFWDGTNVARASWEIGASASVRNVPRSVNYSTVNPAAANGTVGAAALFIGRKTDLTLLAVGALSGTDNTSSTTINNNTRTVTFSVAALEAGVSSTPTQSSFLTATGDTATYTILNAANTLVDPITLGLRNYPMFTLPAPNDSTTVNAEYTINFAASADYNAAIRVAATGSVERRTPRYLTNNGYLYVNDEFLNRNTTVAMTNNTTSGVFGNPITFTFTTTNVTATGVFSFYFVIPVIAVTNSVLSAGVDTAKTWYIRPGYGTNLFDLDNGNGGSGACILMGLDFTVIDPDTIMIASDPANWP